MNWKWQQTLTYSAVMIAALTCAVTAADDAPAENQTYIDGPTGERIAAFATRAERMGFSGAVLAARDGKVVAAIGIGMADDDEKRPNTPATLFEIASITKPFTAAAVVRLAQDGKLALDDSIAKHLPDVPEDCRAITIEHLLRHTSGIPGTNAQGGGDDITEVLPHFLQGGPQHEPGVHWEYWNQGYAMLSEIIANAAGEPYTEYMRKAIFEPADMRSTRFTGDEPPTEACVAIGISQFGAPRSALEHPYGSYGFQYRGMGGIVTSVWDLWRWDRALHGDDLLNDDSKTIIFTPGLNNYALGWYVRTDAAGRTIQSHSGRVRGFACELRRYPEQDALLVVLCNADDVPLHQIVPALETILLAER